MYGLAHIIHGERRRRRRRKCFHFYPGAAIARYRGLDLHAAPALVEPEGEIDSVEQDRVAHWDDIGRALGPHNARDLRHGKHIALFHAAGADEIKCRPIHEHARCGGRGAAALRLFADIDHFGASFVVEVRKILWFFHDRVLQYEIGNGRNILIAEAGHGAFHVHVGDDGKEVLKRRGEALAVFLPRHTDLRQLFVFKALDQNEIDIVYTAEELRERMLAERNARCLIRRGHHSNVRARVGKPPGVLPLVVDLKLVAIVLDDGQTHAARLGLPDELFQQRCLARAGVPGKRHNGYVCHFTLRSRSCCARRGCVPRLRAGHGTRALRE